MHCTEKWHSFQGTVSLTRVIGQNLKKLGIILCTLEGALRFHNLNCFHLCICSWLENEILGVIFKARLLGGCPDASRSNASRPIWWKPSGQQHSGLRCLSVEVQVPEQCRLTLDWYLGPVLSQSDSQQSRPHLTRHVPLKYYETAVWKSE